MQTFMPYPDFQQSLASTDYRRLGKQRVEGKQLITAIEGGSKGWVNHPAAVMWRNYLPALKAYTNAAIQEWVARGYNNTMPLYDVPESYEMPWWMGFDKFHQSHQSNLYRKDANYYTGFAGVGADQPYVWPCQTKGLYRIGNEDRVYRLP